VIPTRFQFKDRDYVVSVPEQFVFDARTMLAQSTVTYEGLERLVQQFEYIESLEPNELQRYAGSVVVVADRKIVYAAPTAADALDWLSENEVPQPALVTETREVL
jgi:hypothetical protein